MTNWALIPIPGRRMKDTTFLFVIISTVPVSCLISDLKPGIMSLSPAEQKGRSHIPLSWHGIPLSHTTKENRSLYRSVFQVYLNTSSVPASSAGI